MPIDWSEPAYEVLLTNYGMTVLTAQMLEKTLLLLLGHVECRELGKDSGSDLLEFLDKQKRMPVDQVIKALKDKLPLPPDLVADLEEVFKQRNDVIHHFFLDRFDGKALTRSPEQMGQELRPIWERLKSLQSRVDTICDAI
jgi:hypothetical protein